MAEQPDLNFIARQIEGVLTEIGSLRDDNRVLTASVMRLDTNQAAMLEELRAVHVQIARMNERIRHLEDLEEDRRPDLK